MIDFSDIEAMRPVLASMCASERLRINPPSPKIQDQRWRPFSVVHPATLSRFNDAAAWEFIRDQFLARAKIKYQCPDGRYDDHAYVMVESDGGSRRIYMKVAVTRDAHAILGISFHYERT